MPFVPAGKGLSKRAKKFNVLFIIADDLRPELGSYGNQMIKTPNIDRIARQGTRFDRAYAQYPLCNPSRSSLLTGRYPTQTRIYNNNDYFRRTFPDWITLPQYFKQNGYATLRSGKIFHGGIDDQVSWTEGGEPTDPAITERGKTPPVQPKKESEDDENESATPQPQEPNRKASNSDRIIVLPNDGESHGDYKAATRAINMLEKYKDKPFFLAVGFVKPHSPPTAPKKFFELYDVDKIQLPIDFSVRPTAPAGFPEVSVPARNTDLFIGRDASPEQAREMIRAYYASTGFMDAQVGRVLDALEKNGLQDDTIIVFWGDHGYHLGEKGKWSKAYSLFEIGLRVPLIIAVPKGKPQATEGVVESLDLYRTLADLCGLPQPEKVEGKTLAPLLKNPKAKWDHPAFSVMENHGVFGRSVRYKNWHYAEYEDGKLGAMLFDISEDPHELKNLADDEKYAKTVIEMKNLLKRIPTENKK
ncbi:MAG: sulfatase [Pyrinomonadaceae bacterium]